jgi:hypothetical protein
MNHFNMDKAALLLYLSFCLLLACGSKVGAQGVYWSQTLTVSDSSVNRVQFDGSSKETIALGGIPFGIVFESGSSLYGTDNLTIYRMKSNGSDRADLGTFSAAGAALDIELDELNGKVYWTTNNAIHRADLSGANHQIILSFGTTSEGLALDPMKGKIYFGTEANGAGNDLVEVINFDGTGRTTFRQLPVAAGVHDVDIDLVTGRIYWSQTDVRIPVADRSIYGANIDGTGQIDHIFNPAGGAGTGIHFDPVDYKLYAFGHPEGNVGSTIYRFNPDGSGVETLVSDIGLGGARYIAVSHVPEPSSVLIFSVSSAMALASWRRRTVR